MAALLPKSVLNHSSMCSSKDGCILYTLFCPLSVGSGLGFWVVWVSWGGGGVLEFVVLGCVFLFFWGGSGSGRAVGGGYWGGGGGLLSVMDLATLPWSISQWGFWGSAVKRKHPKGCLACLHSPPRLSTPQMSC